MKNLVARIHVFGLFAEHLMAAGPVEVRRLGSLITSSRLKRCVLSSAEN